MRKFEIMITTEQGEKKVDVCVDDITGGLLEQCREDIRYVYLKEEYEAQKRDRAETRRHVSLDRAIENGHDYKSQEKSPLDKLLLTEERAYLKGLLARLTDKQREVLLLRAVDGLGLEEIGREMAVKYQTVQQIYAAAIKKIRKLKLFSKNTL